MHELRVVYGRLRHDCATGQGVGEWSVHHFACQSDVRTIVYNIRIRLRGGGYLYIAKIEHVQVCAKHLRQARRLVVFFSPVNASMSSPTNQRLAWYQSFVYN